MAQEHLPSTRQGQSRIWSRRDLGTPGRVTIPNLGAGIRDAQMEAQVCGCGLPGSGEGAMIEGSLGLQDFMHKMGTWLEPSKRKCILGFRREVWAELGQSPVIAAGNPLDKVSFGKGVWK